MRKLGYVLSEIIPLIPDDTGSLVERLRSITRSWEYASPEMEHLWWIEVASEFAVHFPEEEKDFADWQRRVISIWGNCAFEEEAEKESEEAKPE